MVNLLRRLRACVRVEVSSLASDKRLECLRAFQVEKWVLGSNPQNGLGGGAGSRIWQHTDGNWLQTWEQRKLL